MTCENEYRVKFRNEFEDKYNEKINQLGKLHESEVDNLKNEIKINDERDLDGLMDEEKYNAMIS